MSPADEEIMQALEEELARQKALAEKYRLSAITGWESARLLAIDALHHRTEKVADDELTKLQSEP